MKFKPYVRNIIAEYALCDAKAAVNPIWRLKYVFWKCLQMNERNSFFLFPDASESNISFFSNAPTTSIRFIGSTISHHIRFIALLSAVFIQLIICPCLLAEFWWPQSHNFDRDAACSIVSVCHTFGYSLIGNTLRDIRPTIAMYREFSHIDDHEIYS